MPTKHINDLKSTFFGGGTDAEYNYYGSAATAGVTGAGTVLSGVGLASAYVDESVTFTTPATIGQIVYPTALRTAAFVKPNGLVVCETSSLALVTANSGSMRAYLSYSTDGGTNWNIMMDAPSAPSYLYLGFFAAFSFSDLKCLLPRPVGVAPVAVGASIRIAVGYQHLTGASVSCQIVNHSFVTARGL